MGARLFTALIPPTDVVEALEAFVEPRRDADPAVRWTSPESWHLTTSFMESVPDARFEPLADNLKEVAGRSAPMTVRLGGAGAFPNPAEARVLYLAAAEQPEGALAHLAAGCRGAANRAGAAPDGSRFVPHVTVARMRRPIEATRWLRVLDAAPELTFEATEFALVQSHLKEGRARYEIVEWFTLGGGAGHGYPAPDIEG